MDTQSGVLIDTSTLLRARLDRFRSGHLDSADSLALEALLFHDNVFLDGPSIERNSEFLYWLDEMDSSVVRLDIREEGVRLLYERGCSLADHLVSSTATVQLLRMHVVPDIADELAPGQWGPSTYWSDLPQVLPTELQAVRERLEAAFYPNVPFSAMAFVTLSRLLYYLALQEQIGGSLLLDPMRSFLASDAGSWRHHQPSGMPGRPTEIFEVFDEEVLARHIERRKKWLGSSDVDIRLPLIGRYVALEAERKGWSVGRTVAWLRDSPEVIGFRQGFRELTERINAGNNEAVDEILAELDRASLRWSSQLGSKAEVARMKITVPMPFIEPEFNIPIGRLRTRSPADCMLVFIAQVLRGSQ